MPGLKAISVGTGVPQRDFDAVVHSVFQDAANLQPPKGSRLFTLVTADCADLPQGVRIGTPPGFSFERILEPGKRMICRDGLLRDEHGRLMIDMRTATRWKCRLPSVDTNIPSVVAAWTLAWNTLDERQRRIGAEIRAAELFRADLRGQSAVARKMGACVRELVVASHRSEQPAEASIAGLVGLGPGLTPAGDDFLIGFLAGLYCTTGDNEKCLAFFSKLEKMVVRLSCLTNDISRTYLFHATRGQVSSKLATLALMIAIGDDSDNLLRVVEDAMRVGHSSGMETVSGFLVGISPKEAQEFSKVMQSDSG